jgi:ribokinase
MSILNIGSVNIDHVYAVDHFVRPGETLASSRHDIYAGGKGFNQSVALARAGAVIRHAGKVGRDAAWLLERLEHEGVDVTHVGVTETATGHAVIQVAPTGENAIVLYGGANLAVRETDIARAVSSALPGDYLLVQNETSAMPSAIRLARQHGLRVVFNPAPMSPDVRGYPLQDVDLFILNETEAEGLTGQKTPESVRAAMSVQFPRAAVVLTMGRQGAVYFDSAQCLHQPAIAVSAVDTTAAGDTFIGYFLAELMRSNDHAGALLLGCRAAAICVTRPGASDSIPFRRELELDDGQAERV